MHHITHIKNLENILKSKKLIARNFLKHEFTDTANHGIINSRIRVNDKDLNDYVPFHNDNFQIEYGIPYNYRVCKNNGKSKMIYLIFDSIKVTFSPFNKCLYYIYHPTSNYYKECYSFGEFLEMTNLELNNLPKIFKNKLDFSSHYVKEYLMSEILVYDYVSLDYLKKIFVYNNETKEKVEELLKKYKYENIKVYKNSKFYR